MNKRICLVLALFILVPAAVFAEDFPEIIENTIRVSLPDDWPSFALSENAAAMGVLYSLASPDGGISLQILHSPDTALEDTIAVLGTADSVTALEEHPGEPAYISYQVDMLYCYVVQLSDTSTLAFYFTLINPDSLEQIGPLAQEMMTSIEIVNPLA
jgi:hypothetical protein